MKGSSFKFVIVGTGNIATTYLKAINNISGAEVTGIISRTLKKPDSLLDNTDIQIAASLSEIKKDFDAAIICTPNGLHHISAIEAALLGKHILVEKPLDISIEAMDKIIETCRNTNVKLGVAFQRRVSGDNPVIKKFLDENKLGKILAVNLSIKNFRTSSYYSNSTYRGTYSIDGGGPFIQQAVHYIDLYAWYFGKPDKIKSSLYRLFHKIEAEDFGIAICEHKNGMIGNIIASTAIKPGFPAILEIHTEKGTVVMGNDEITFWSIEGVENPSLQKNKNNHSVSSNQFVEDTTNHEIIINDFISSVQNNHEPIINGNSARLATEIVLEIYKNNLNNEFNNFKIKNPA